MNIRLLFVLIVPISFCAGLISCKKKDAVTGQTYRIDSIRVNNIPFKNNVGESYASPGRLNLIISFHDCEFYKDGFSESQLPVTIKPISPNNPLLLSSTITELTSEENSALVYFYILARNEAIPGRFDTQIDKVRVQIPDLKGQKIYTVGSASGKSSLSFFITTF